MAPLFLPFVSGNGSSHSALAIPTSCDTGPVIRENWKFCCTSQSAMAVAVLERCFPKQRDQHHVISGKGREDLLHIASVGVLSGVFDGDLISMILRHFVAHRNRDNRGGGSDGNLISIT
jgi:hypothetical protein